MSAHTRRFRCSRTNKPPPKKRPTNSSTTRPASPFESHVTLHFATTSHFATKCPGSHEASRGSVSPATSSASTFARIANPTSKSQTKSRAFAPSPSPPLDSVPRSPARHGALYPVPCGVSAGHYQISAGTLGLPGRYSERPLYPQQQSRPRQHERRQYRRRHHAARSLRSHPCKPGSSHRPLDRLRASDVRQRRQSHRCRHCSP